MKAKSFKKILILLMLVALIFIAAACHNNGETGGGSNDPNISNPRPEALELSEKITNGLKNAGSSVAAMNIRHVYSQYTFRANTINITITYEADYNLQRKQDSEIMLKVYDNQLAKNIVFYYYYSGILYSELNGEREYTENFGNTNSFDIFFSLMQAFDLDSYFFADPELFENNEEFVEAEDYIGIQSFASYLSMIILAAESNSLSRFQIGDNAENIRITDVALDKLKEPINKFIVDVIKAKFGTRLDALTSMLLGFNLSDLGNLGIGILNASLLNVAIKDNKVQSFELIFDGYQSNNISTFELSMEYQVEEGSRRVSLHKNDDPAYNYMLSGKKEITKENENAYWLTRSGEYHYIGTLSIDSLDHTFYTEIKANLNSANNLDNQVLIDIRDKTDNTGASSSIDKSMISIYYNHNKDETTYIDIQGIIDYYIGDSIALGDLNFPRIKQEGVNLAEQMSTFNALLNSFISNELDYESILKLFAGYAEESKLNMLLSKIDSKGSVIEIDFDKELIDAMLQGYSFDILSWFVSISGVDSDTLNDLFGTGAFDGITFKLAYDYITKEIKISVYNYGIRTFVLTLVKQYISESKLIINPPKGFDKDQYEFANNPEAVRLILEGDITLAGKDKADFSRIMGAFIGDDTGTNTPFAFNLADSFKFTLNFWYENGYSFVTLVITYNNQPLLKLYTSPDEPDTFLIDNANVNYNNAKATPMKYKLPRESLSSAFNNILGEDNIFTNTNVMEILNILTMDTNVYMVDDWITFNLAPYSDANGSSRDPVYNIIGIENLVAKMRARIVFDKPNTVINPDEYLIPYVESLPSRVFESIYEAHWHETVDVYFGASDVKVNFKLTFRGDSAQLVTGVYRYTPTAELMGQEITYVMVITDGENGAKRIVDLGLSILTIDPTTEQPIPDKISVVYDDNSMGYQPFVIEGFPYNNDTIIYQINGAAPTNYVITIGKGSIAEISFNLPVEILNRSIIVDQYAGNVPIIGMITIDPYEYSYLKGKDSEYDPLDIHRNQILRFRSNQDPTAFVEELVYLDWDFDLNSITYRGLSIYVYAYFNTMKVALEVNVLTRIISHISYEGELNGEYTVDALVYSTYKIPQESSNNMEIRIYFETKQTSTPLKYRIVGKEPDGWVNTDPNCDGYYQFELKWRYESANPNFVTLNRDVNPLGDDFTSTNLNTATFGDDIVGTQTIRLIVNSPSRSVLSLTTPQQLIQDIIYYPNGSINLEETLRQSRSTIVSAVALGDGTRDGDPFDIDPYAKSSFNTLPDHISMEVAFAGQTVRKSYSVRWISSSIINEYGTMLRPLSAGAQLVARGIIGDDKARTQVITVVLNNLDGGHEELIIFDSNNQQIMPDNSTPPRYTITINPYGGVVLPEEFTLRFSEASGYGLKVYKTYTEVFDEVKQEMTRVTNWEIFDKTTNSWKKVDITNSFAYDATEDYQIRVVIAADPLTGILEQTVTLYVNIVSELIVDKDFIGGLSDTFDAEGGKGQDNHFEIDNYTEESLKIYEKLLNGDLSYTVKFRNGTTAVAPIQWEQTSKEKLILALISATGSGGTTIELVGYIYHGTILEQRVNLNIIVISRVISDITYDYVTNYSTKYLTKDVFSTTFEPASAGDYNRVTIDINKPYALVNEMGDRGYNQGLNLDMLITNLINSLLSNVYLTFSDNNLPTISVKLHYSLPEKDGVINDKTAEYFNFKPGERFSTTLLGFVTIGEGSSQDVIQVIVKVANDLVQNSTISLSVETFNANGTLAFSNEEGYSLPEVSTIIYQKDVGDPYNVDYMGLKWYATMTIIGSDGKGIEHVDESDPNRDNYVVSSIPASLFGLPGGATINLYTYLEPQGIRIGLSINILAKNINKVNYNSADTEANASKYKIENGKITIKNIYDFYPFNTDLLPTVIQPHITSTYHISQNVITFAINENQWTPTEDFGVYVGTGSDRRLVFDQDKINAYFNSKGFTGSIVFATAKILMYNEEYQEIELRVEVAELAAGVITHSDSNYNFVNNVLTIDPYINNFQGVMNIPKDITVTFGSGINEVKSTFNTSSNIKYQINRGGIYEDITSIPYTHLGHALGSDFGLPTDALQLKLILPDGKEVNFTIIFSRRELDTVLIQNYTSKDDVDGLLEKLYYIDPYNETTHTLPNMASFIFDNATRILPINAWYGSDLSKFDSNYKLIWVPGETYKGGIYYFTARLEGYGESVSAQEFILKVVVLDRSLEEKINLVGDLAINIDPISYLVSDIAKDNEITEANMKDLLKTTELMDLYGKFYEIADPVLPKLSLSYYIENGVQKPFVDDDIDFDGFRYVVYGNLGTGSLKGEEITIEVWSYAYEFNKIEGITDSIIDFNPHTLKSFMQEFEVLFDVIDPATGFKVGEKRITFYDKDWLKDNDYEKRKTVIDFGEKQKTNESYLATLTLLNQYKSHKYVIGGIYSYNYAQLTITRLDFGFGYGIQNEVVLVIDPFNPIIPDKANALGYDVADGNKTEKEIGEVTVEWESIIYNMSMGQNNLIINATIFTSRDEPPKNFLVNVYYLDRRPLGIYAEKEGYSTLLSKTDNGYTIMERTDTNAAANYMFRFDPIDERTYRDGEYLLPERLVITFKSRYTDMEHLNNAALMFGTKFLIRVLEWELSDLITLNGTSVTNGDVTIDTPIIARIKRFAIIEDVPNPNGSGMVEKVIAEYTYEYDLTDKYSNFELKLSVVDRHVIETNISESRISIEGNVYQEALENFFIDPYNISFPSPVTIKFKNGNDTISKLITDVVWLYDKEHLERDDVITGTISENAMNIVASIKIYGTELKIQFPIRARNIDTSIGDGSMGTLALSGGTIYVLKGKDLRSQLPKQLYYNFNKVEIAAAPLSFSESNLIGINTSATNTYVDVKGTLGTVGSDNIKFTIVVIDPTVYNIRSVIGDEGESYRRGGFIYDNVVVAYGSGNYYTPGREQTILPNRIIINDEGDYLNVISQEYNIGAKTLTLNCNYLFLSDTDCPDLRGNNSGEDDGRRLYISIVLPIETYDHTKISEAQVLKIKASAEDKLDDERYLSILDELQLPREDDKRKHIYASLGVPILASQMPLVYGINTGLPLNIIWNMTELNINVAGVYKCIGYYKTTYNINEAVEMYVIVKKALIKDGDISISTDWLNREYSGGSVPISLTIKDFLRSDGKLGAVQGYSVLYSRDGGNQYVLEQPEAVATGVQKYYVKIIIEDYNVMGEAVFEFTIRPKIIYGNTVSFYENENSTSSSPSGSVSYEYSGEILRPVIKGIPDKAAHTIKYFYYNTLTGSYEETNPVGAGQYKVEVNFPTQTNFQTVEGAETQSWLFTITKKNVHYEVVKQIYYNGRERDAEITDLPTGLPAGFITYNYYTLSGDILTSKPKNAGIYRVVVTILESQNFPAGALDDTFEILPIDVRLVVGTVETEYLEQLLPLNSMVEFLLKDSDESAMQYEDRMEMFRPLISVSWQDGTLTYKHMVGSYILDAVLTATIINYRVVEYVSGVYNIAANARNVELVKSRAQLVGLINTLKSNDEVKWYLMPEVAGQVTDYGSITIDKNATVSIVGSYFIDFTGEEIAVSFKSITILNGGVAIDIVKINAISSHNNDNIQAGVFIGKDALDVTINRSRFYRTNTSSYLSDSVAVKAELGYTGTLRMSETYIEGHSIAVYMLDGSCDIQNSIFEYNISGIQMRNAVSISIINNEFNYNRGTAIYVLNELDSDNLSINDNIFNANIIGIKTYTTLNKTVMQVQNVFTYNATNIQNLKEI